MGSFRRFPIRIPKAHFAILLALLVFCLDCDSEPNARESVLRQNLFTLRSVIDHYSMDKKKAPQSLQDLVDAGYLKRIPVDPMTNSRDTWQTVQEDTLVSVDQDQPGITDVHSGSQAIGSDGTAYNQW